jgi:hypothetical protein
MDSLELTCRLTAAVFGVMRNCVPGWSMWIRSTPA